MSTMLQRKGHAASNTTTATTSAGSAAEHANIGHPATDLPAQGRLRPAATSQEYIGNNILYNDKILSCQITKLHFSINRRLNGN